jgi:hypothetical protein
MLRNEKRHSDPSEERHRIGAERRRKAGFCEEREIDQGGRHPLLTANERPCERKTCKGGN